MDGGCHLSLASDEGQDSVLWWGVYFTLGTLPYYSRVSPMYRPTRTVTAISPQFRKTKGKNQWQVWENGSNYFSSTPSF